MTQSGQYLEKILTEMAYFQRQNKRALAVFDLDSTLFDVGPRLKKILHDFAADTEFKKKFPDACELLSSAETQRTDWGIKDAVMRAGLGDHSTELHQALREFWRVRFFSNEYLHFDRPYEGAVEFVQKVEELQCDIAYLTGRDVRRMGIGSQEVLRKWQMPLNESSALLVLKPQQGMDDAAFKSDWFASLPEGQYEKIWFFENEPVNVNLVRSLHKHIEIVFFDSTHSRQESPPIDVPRIINFLFRPDELRGTED
jgi:hypothetical protein